MSSNMSANLTFSGFQKLDLINFPGYMACTVYTAGCNLRCPYCHNPGLASGSSDEAYTADEVLSYIEKRKGMLEALVVSGGEPTLHFSNLEKATTEGGASCAFEAFLKSVKSLGLLVKLDTNGCRPAVVRSLIDSALIDYVALDIKAPLDEEGYSRVKPLIPAQEAAENIKQTLEILRSWSDNWEVRTTYLPYLLSTQDIFKMVQQTGRVPKWYIQAFNPAVTLDGTWGQLSAPQEKDCQEIVSLMREKGVNAFVR